MQETQEMWVRSLDPEDPLEKGNDSPLQYSCLENPMNRGAWWATVCGVAKSQTQLMQLSMHTCKQSSAICVELNETNPLFMTSRTRGNADVSCSPNLFVPHFRQWGSVGKDASCLNQVRS